MSGKVPKRRVFARLVVVLALIVWIRPAAAAPSHEAPRLVVVLFVDQMPATFLDRFAPWFGDDGFRRLAREGRVFADARYRHANTSTAPGHAVIGTGRYPRDHGIVGNAWFSVPADAPVYSAGGPTRPGDPGRCAPDGAVAGAGSNPCWLRGPSLARRVKQRWPKARVVGASIKDRSAVLAMGEGADAAYWFDDRIAQRFVTSPYYRSDPDRLARLNAAVLPAFERLLDPRDEPATDRLWQFSLPRPRVEVCPDDATGVHRDILGLRATFPHAVHSLRALAFSPFGNDLLGAFVTAAARDWGLGKNPDGAPDVLVASFSSADHVGHYFGPDSCEVADMMARLDRTLAALVSDLDASVGRARSLVVLTADHGVATVPEVARGRGGRAGRVYLEDDGARTVGELSPHRLSLERAFAAARGVRLADTTPIARAVVRSFQESFVYLNRSVVGAADLAAARTVAKRALTAIEGVAEAWTADDVAAGVAPESVRLAFDPQRSGDLMVILQPGYILDRREAPMATNHGQPHVYDAHVPLIVWGGGVTPATVRDPVDVARIAPTLAAALDLNRDGFHAPEPLPLAPAR